MSQKIIAIFAGQGSQFQGMGKDLYLNSDAARNVFNNAVEVMGEKITDLCFETEIETLTRTVNAQPAIYTVSYAAFEAFREYLKKNNNENSVEICAFAGHSLGEYTALAAAGVSSFSNTLSFVNKRAAYMQQAGEENEGTMAAIMGLSFEQLDGLCREVEKDLDTIVSVGLFNTPSQLVASGTKKGIEEIIKRATEAGARRAMPLTVGGPFHTAIMSSAAEKLQSHVKDLDVKQPEKDVALNGFGIVTRETDKISEGVIKQINNPILWVKCVQSLVEKYPDAVFVEFCPKTVLKGLVRKIDKQLKVYTVDNMENLEKTVAGLMEKTEKLGE